MEPIQIKDIKPLIAIHDDGIYFLLVLIVIGVVAVLAVGYLLVRWYKHKHVVSTRQENYRLLGLVNFNDPKKAAYDVTKYGYIFKDDTARNREMYENIVQRLQGYKYKAKVDLIDDETRSYIELYRGMIDV